MTNAAYNKQFLNSQTADITGVETLPLSVPETGTLTTLGLVVTGIGTLFTTQFEVGDFIFDSSQAAIRRIKYINTDTSITLEASFPIDISVAISAVKTPKSFLKEISIFNQGPGNGLVNGATIIQGETKTWTKSARYDTGQKDYIDPVVVDGTGTTLEYEILY